MKSRFYLSILLFSLVATSVKAEGVTSADDLARKLANPVASLISVPLQSNFDFGIGANDGWRYTLNVQPVIPISLNENWNLISRTILPFVHQEDVYGTSSQDGLSDTVQSFFFSPKDATSNGWILGAGPVLLLPTATDDLLGAEKWGAGPTAVALKQVGPWTYGALANHLWSFAGDEDRTEVNATFIQPFVSYITATKTTFTLNAETTYDWEQSQWSVPLNVIVSQLFIVGGHPMQASLGGRYFAEGPDGAPEWGVRAVLTFLFPKS